MPGDFTDLIAWQEAIALVGAVERVVKRISGPNAMGMSDQLLRAAESIPANIAEGYGRGIGKDFCRFLRIAAASAGEVETHLHSVVISHRLATELAAPVIARARRVRALVTGLRESIARRG